MVRTGMQRLQDNVNFLRSVPLLQNLNSEVLAKIADVLEVVSYCSTISKKLKAKKHEFVGNVHGRNLHYKTRRQW